MELIKALWEIEMMKLDLFIEYWYIWVVFVVIVIFTGIVEIIKLKRK